MNSKVKIGKSFTFHAAHRLPRHNGKCRRLHGHTYKVEVVLEGELSDLPDSSEGMVLDFGELSATMKHIDEVNTLDHGYLNDVLDVPTAENLACFLLEELMALRKYEDLVHSVKVWETDSSWAQALR